MAAFFILTLLSAVALSAAVVALDYSTVASSMTATYKNPRFRPRGTMAEEKVEKPWRVGATNLAPAVTTASYLSSTPENVFHEWPGAFIGADNDTNPATLFLPFSKKPSRSPKLRIVAAYHIVPEKLEFSDLLSKSLLSRLPTLVPGTSIVVTNNSYSNFTLDDVLIIKPDLFVSSSIVIHGISSRLEFVRNGGFSAGDTASSSFLVIASAAAIRRIKIRRSCSSMFLPFLILISLVSWFVVSL